MENPEKNIDWDKLIPKLEDLGSDAGPGFAEDSEEARQLRMAREMRGRLNAGAPDDQFPAEEGWQRFRENLERENTGRSKVRWLYWAGAAAAAAIIAVAGVRYYQQTATPGKVPAVVAEHQPSGKVEIKSSNGKSLVLTDNAQEWQPGNGASVSADNQGIVYSESAGAAVTMDTLVVPRGNKTRIQLADGTVVWMNAASRLIYPSAFTGPKREIQLEGEAYFDVAQDASHPFVVTADGMNVEVLGTEFNINTYSEIVYTTLAQGKVKTSAAGKSLLMQPGDQVAFDRAAGEMDRRVPDMRSVTAWKDGQIYFEDVRLEDITKTLGRDYDYQFRFEDESLRQLSFTLDMPRPASLKAVLEQISRTAGDVRFRMEDNIVYLSR